MRYLCVLRAYSSLAMPAEDTISHAVEFLLDCKDILEPNTDLAVALLDNYASCGRLLKAEQYFEHLYQARASVSILLWNIMIKVQSISWHVTQLAI